MPHYSKKVSFSYKESSEICPKNNSYLCGWDHAVTFADKIPRIIRLTGTAFFEKGLDLLPVEWYNIARNEGGDSLPKESRAEYFRQRRTKYKSFTVEIEREKMERFEQRLNENQTTKAKWLNEKIDEELGE